MGFWGFFFNWNIVDLQYCISFRCITKWFSYTYTHFFRFFSLTDYYKILSIVHSIFTFIYKIVTNKGLLYSTGNYAQYLITIYKGKESEKVYIYMYNWTTLLYTWNQCRRKLVNCKSVVFQLKKNTDMPAWMGVLFGGRMDTCLCMAEFLPCSLKWSESLSLMSNSLWPHGLYSAENSTGQNTGVGRLSLLQGIFQTEGSNPGLPNCRWILYQLSHKGSPPFSLKQPQNC